jgi:hypothetical protein
MSVGSAIILHMTTYNKYTWVCTGDCDALIEYTIKDGFGWPAGEMNLTCRCNSDCILLSVEDATIPYTDTKLTEEKMDTTTIESDAFHSPAVPYNPDLLVTYKVIKGYSDPEFTTSKVASLEWDLHNGRQSQKSVGVLQDKINVAKDIIAEAYVDSNDQDTLRSIAEALGIELTRTIEFTATIEVSGTVEVDLLEDYELEDDIADNLYVDSQSGRIEIGDIEVCHVREA